MCDYSLHEIENRLAEEDEVLVVHRFYSGSKGLTSPEYVKSTEQSKGWMAVLKRMFAAKARVCAVCVPERGSTHAQWDLAVTPASLRSLHDRSGDLPPAVCECWNVSRRRRVQERSEGSSAGSGRRSDSKSQRCPPRRPVSSEPTLDRSAIIEPFREHRNPWGLNRTKRLSPPCKRGDSARLQSRLPFCLTGP